MKGCTLLADCRGGRLAAFAALSTCLLLFDRPGRAQSEIYAFQGPESCHLREVFVAPPSRELQLGEPLYSRVKDRIKLYYSAGKGSTVEAITCFSEQVANIVGIDTHWIMQHATVRTVTPMIEATRAVLKVAFAK